jgi:hypothetical protein
MAHCARTRLLEILATRAAEMRGVPPAERGRFVTEHVTEWQQTLSAEYAGETVRVTTERVTRTDRAARDARILAAKTAGDSARATAQRERVSLRLVRIVWGRVQNAT